MTVSKETSDTTENCQLVSAAGKRAKLREYCRFYLTSQWETACSGVAVSYVGFHSRFFDS